ncbi:hypothetical protein DASC09_045330 [Saccharomycopsis crataegensis]|uniref:DH domain-containing protein n=1 Tax=Saccharomycopsis crataegensis TaxID=43959 RepID=A0AAV5QQY4_9ASCO|nr:hypothetical protein DASC09_045330 [Saccharomycopsis crataegensis]
MPVSKLSLKVLDELNVETNSPEAKKIDIAISSRSQYLKDLKNNENLYLVNLEKLLSYSQSASSSGKPLVLATQNIIRSHLDLYKILDKYIKPESNMSQLDEIYCLRDVSNWCLIFNRHYIAYCQHYNYDPFLPEMTSNLTKLPFIRYKALVKLLTKFYQMSLHFENSLPDFKFTDMSLRLMFVEITNNFQKASKFASIQWEIIKDYLNNEKLYVDYFSINFNMTRNLETLRQIDPHTCQFNPNNILKRDYFEFEFHHPNEVTSNKKIIELILLSDKSVNDYTKLHQSHASRSLEKLAKMKSREDLLSAANDEIIDTVFDSILQGSGIKQGSGNSHNRETSEFSMVSTDVVEESYKGSLDFKFTEIAGLAICAIDSSIGRNLIFPTFQKDQLSIRSVNKSANEIVLVHPTAPNSEQLITIKISSLDEEQFNNWSPFLKVLFPFYYEQTEGFFKQHQMLKNQMEFKDALGINLNIPKSFNAIPGKFNLQHHTSIKNKDQVSPLKFSKKSSPVLNNSVDPSNKAQRLSGDMAIPELDSFLQQLESDCNANKNAAEDVCSPPSDGFHFNEISYSNNATPTLDTVANTSSLPTNDNRVSRSTSRSSRLSRSQKINNFDKVLKDDHAVSLYDNESDWTSITTNSAISSPKLNDSSDVSRVVNKFFNDGSNKKDSANYNRKSTRASVSSIATGDFINLQTSPTSHPVNSLISEAPIDEAEEHETTTNSETTEPDLPVSISASTISPTASNRPKTPLPQVPTSDPASISAYRTPAFTILGKNKSTANLVSSSSQDDEKSSSKISLTKAVDQLNEEFAKPQNIEDGSKPIGENEEIPDANKDAASPSLSNFFGRNKKSYGTPLFKKLFFRSTKSKKLETTAVNKRDSFIFSMDQTTKSTVIKQSDDSMESKKNATITKPLLETPGTTVVYRGAHQAATVSTSVPKSVISKKKALDHHNTNGTKVFKSESQKRLSVVARRRSQLPASSSENFGISKAGSVTKISKSGSNPRISRKSSRTSFQNIGANVRTQSNTSSGVLKHSSSAKRLSTINGKRKRVSTTMQLEITKQQKIFDDLILNNPAPNLGDLTDNESIVSLPSPKYTNIVIPNNYSVSSLSSNDNKNVTETIEDSPIKLNINNSESFGSSLNQSGSMNSTFSSPRKLNFAGSNHSPSKSSFLSRTTTVSNSSFVTGLTHQENSNSDLKAIVEDEPANNGSLADLNDATRKPGDGINSDDEDIPIPKEDYLKEKFGKGIAGDSAPIAADDGNNDADDEQDESIHNINYLSNFGKEYEPKFLSASPSKKFRGSRLLSLRRRKSVDFEIVTKSPAKTPNSVGGNYAASPATSFVNSPASGFSTPINGSMIFSPPALPSAKKTKPYNLSENESKTSIVSGNMQRASSVRTVRSNGTNSTFNNTSKETTLTKSKDAILNDSKVSLKRKGSFDALKKIASPIPNAFTRKDKHQRELSAKTPEKHHQVPSAKPNFSPMKPTISASASGFASITDQYLANVDNCIIIYKDFYHVSFWKLNHWAPISDELLYMEVAISSEQSYLCFYKSDSLKSSLVSIKPFVILAVDSNSVVTKTKNDSCNIIEDLHDASGMFDVQLKTFNEFTKKTNLVCLRYKNYTSSINLLQALEFAQQDHTNNSMIKTRQQLSNNSGNSMFCDGVNSSVSGDTASSVSVPPSEYGKKPNLTISVSRDFVYEEPPMTAISANFEVSTPKSESGASYLSSQTPMTITPPHSSCSSSSASSSSQLNSINSHLKGLKISTNHDTVTIVKKIRFHKKSSISGKWNPIAISMLKMRRVSPGSKKFHLVITEFKTEKVLIDASIDGSTTSRIGRTGVCIAVPSMDGITVPKRPNYLVESRNQLEADELFAIFTSTR